MPRCLDCRTLMAFRISDNSRFSFWRHRSISASPGSRGTGHAGHNSNWIQCVHYYSFYFNPGPTNVQVYGDIFYSQWWKMEQRLRGYKYTFQDVMFTVLHVTVIELIRYCIHIISYSYSFGRLYLCFFILICYKSWLMDSWQTSKSRKNFISELSDALTRCNLYEHLLIIVSL